MRAGSSTVHWVSASIIRSGSVRFFQVKRVAVSRLYTSDTNYRLYDTPTDKHILLVIQPEYKTGKVEKPYVPAKYKLEEAVSLVESITGWTVFAQRLAAVRNIHSKMFFGKGKLSELREVTRSLPVTGVYLNTPHLTPIQHKTLESVFGTEVFDRFGIVLRIFKERARTKEAKLQVALAEIPYLRTRFLEVDPERPHVATGEEGERDLTAVKRNIHRKREVAIREELKSIRKQRQLMGVQRKKHHLPIVAVVGYTNAGKTTLIQALSKDEKMCPEDRLFATLDTTIHAGKLPCGQKVLYVDTIGFVSDIPHQLVEAFSSTLDDVAHADILIHVRDLSHPQSYSQKSAVMEVLSHMAPNLVHGMIEAGNKTDQLEGGYLKDNDHAIPISAIHRTGLHELLCRLEQAVISRTQRKIWKILLPSNGPELSWLYGEPEATVCSVSDAALPTTSNLVHSQIIDNTVPTTTTLVSQCSQPILTDYLTARVILTEAACSKFQAKFSHSIRMIDIMM